MEKDKAKVNAYSKAYYERRKEEVKARNKVKAKEYYKKNREKVLGKLKKVREDKEYVDSYDAEKRRQKNREYYLKRKEEKSAEQI